MLIKLKLLREVLHFILLSCLYAFVYLTRFGHQDSITGIDSLLRERAITSGGRDGSVRIWKIVEESQLVFHGGSYVEIINFFLFHYNSKMF